MSPEPSTPSSPSTAVFAGRRVLVTGASRGFGRAIAQAFAAAGADVGVNFVENRAKAEETAKLVEAAGRRAAVLQADVSDPAAVVTMFDAFEDALGGSADILVNNAGLNRAKDFLEIPPVDLDRIFDVNVKGVFHCTQEFARRILPSLEAAREPARVVNIASAAGIDARPGSVHYGAAKAAVISITKSTAEALAPRVVVNALAPGFFDTELNAYVPQPVREAITKQVPMRRWGEVEEVSRAVLLLAQMPAYVTGQTLAIDGGITNVYFTTP